MDECFKTAILKTARVRHPEVQKASKAGAPGYFFSDGGRTAFPTCLLYSAISMGEHRNSDIS